MSKGALRRTIEIAYPSAVFLAIVSSFGISRGQADRGQKLNNPLGFDNSNQGPALIFSNACSKPSALGFSVDQWVCRKETEQEQAREDHFVINKN